MLEMKCIWGDLWRRRSSVSSSALDIVEEDDSEQSNILESVEGQSSIERNWILVKSSLVVELMGNATFYLY